MFCCVAPSPKTKCARYEYQSFCEVVLKLSRDSSHDNNDGDYVYFVSYGGYRHSKSTMPRRCPTPFLPYQICRVCFEWEAKRICSLCGVGEWRKAYSGQASMGDVFSKRANKHHNTELAGRDVHEESQQPLPVQNMLGDMLLNKRANNLTRADTVERNVHEEPLRMHTMA